MFRSLALVFVFMLVGCSESSMVPQTTHRATAESTQSGGAFTANYAGTGAISIYGCSGSFNFAGHGLGTFIGKGSESGSEQASMATRCHWQGSAKLVSKRHPANTITVSLNSDTHFNPCLVGAAWVVTSGTGKFVNATGSGNVGFTCNQNGTYSDQWSGTLTF